ncbi:glycosyltransferase family 4 protein [Photobacterium toruni]|uniref:Glycosyltransferase family 4 protein n=1 Tax=Photobacterium toruni TaxID=1935446 RepID=A0ABU6L618_9GAMM|nr:glycosyltransferase family 4 protein [Photobacterium toruni]
MIVPSLDKKGPVIVAINLSNYYVKLGYDVDLLYLKEVNNRIFIDKRVRVKKLDLRSFCKFSDYDIIHSNSFLPDLITRIVSYFFRKPIYFSTVHNFMKRDFNIDYGPIKACILGFLWPLLINKTKKIFISEAQEKYLLTNYFSSNYKGQNIQIYNPVVIDDDDFSSKKEINDFICEIKNKNGKIIGVSSVLTKRKSIDTVIKSMRLLPDHYTLIVIGSGSERINLEELCFKIGVSERVIFTGFISNPFNLLKKVDLFVFPSEVEAFGLSGIEAGMLGIPLVVSEIDTFIELYPKNIAGFFPVGDENALSEAIMNKMAEDIDVEYIKRAFDEKFSLRVVSKQYLEFYNES